MPTNQPIKQKPPRLIRLLIASSLVLGLASLRVNADEMTVRAELKSEAARLLEQGDLATYDQRYGVTALGNAVLDQTGGSTYPTTVYGKHVTSGRNRTPTMRLGPWGPRATEQEATAPWDVYRSTNVGEKVCVVLHPGAFGVPWYRIAKCQPTT
jgi:hypothetical protein